MDDDFLDINLRSPEEVAARILILDALGRRLIVENVAIGEQGYEGDPEEMMFDLRAWLVDSGAVAHLTSGDRDYLDTQPGEIEPRLILGLACWRQALEVLLSTCGLIPRKELGLPYADSMEIPADLDLEEKSVKSLAMELKMPPFEQAAVLREVAELWHWRAETEDELRRATPPERNELLEDIHETAQEASEAGLIRVATDGDFAFTGTPIRKWSDFEVMMYTLPSVTRLRALNWLCGFGIDWEDSPIYV